MTSASPPVFSVQEGKPLVVNVAEFHYSYKCKHCGHEWTEKTCSRTQGTTIVTKHNGPTSIRPILSNSCIPIITILLIAVIVVVVSLATLEIPSILNALRTTTPATTLYSNTRHRSHILRHSHRYKIRKPDIPRI